MAARRKPSACGIEASESRLLPSKAASKKRTPPPRVPQAASSGTISDEAQAEVWAKVRSTANSISQAMSCCGNSVFAARQRDQAGRKRKMSRGYLRQHAVHFFSPRRALNTNFFERHGSFMHSTLCCPAGQRASSSPDLLLVCGMACA